MKREFWERATPDDDPAVLVHGFELACGPDQHESSCVISALPVIVVEGVHNREHMVRLFISWEPNGRHARLRSASSSGKPHDRWYYWVPHGLATA